MVASVSPFVCHYQSRVFVCVSVMRWCTRIIARMRSLGFQLPNGDGLKSGVLQNGIGGYSYVCLSDPVMSRVASAKLKREPRAKLEFRQHVIVASTDFSAVGRYYHNMIQN